MPTPGCRTLALAVGLALCGSATAADAPAVDTLFGSQVPARADAPAVATTSQVRSQYVLHCAGCHGFDGAGSRQGQVPDMRRMGDFLRVPGGREFVLQVPGVMGSGLDDAQVAAVTNWLLATLAAPSRPADFRPYDAAEVARARARPLVDVAAQRRQLVEAGRALGLALP